MGSPTVNIILKAIDQTKAVLISVRRGFKRLWRDTIGGANRAVHALLTVQNAMISLAAVAAARMVLRPAIQKEQFMVQLEVLLGGIKEAQERFKGLEDFAARTPFRLPEIVRASKTLQVMTDGALATGKALEFVGDVSAGTGERIDELAVWFGRLYSTLKSGRKDIGRPLRRLQQIGALSGQARTEIEKLVAANAGFAQSWGAVTAAMGRYTGMTSKLALTAGGAWTTLQDNVNQALAEIGEEALPMLSDIMREIIGRIQELRASGELQEWGRAARDIIESLYGKMKWLADFIIKHRVLLKNLGMTYAAYKILEATTRAAETTTKAYRALAMAAGAAKAAHWLPGGGGGGGGGAGGAGGAGALAVGTHAGGTLGRWAAYRKLQGQSPMDLGYRPTSPGASVMAGYGKPSPLPTGFTSKAAATAGGGFLTGGIGTAGGAGVGASIGLAAVVAAVFGYIGYKIGDAAIEGAMGYGKHETLSSADTDRALIKRDPEYFAKRAERTWAEKAERELLAEKKALAEASAIHAEKQFAFIEAQFAQRRALALEEANMAQAANNERQAIIEAEIKSRHQQSARDHTDAVRGLRVAGAAKLSAAKKAANFEANKLQEAFEAGKQKIKDAANALRVAQEKGAEAIQAAQKKVAEAEKKHAVIVGRIGGNKLAQALANAQLKPGALRRNQRAARQQDKRDQREEREMIKRARRNEHDARVFGRRLEGKDRAEVQWLKEKQKTDRDIKQAEKAKDQITKAKEQAEKVKEQSEKNITGRQDAIEKARKALDDMRTRNAELDKKILDIRLENALKEQDIIDARRKELERQREAGVIRNAVNKVEAEAKEKAVRIAKEAQSTGMQEYQIKEAEAEKRAKSYSDAKEALQRVLADIKKGKESISQGAPGRVTTENAIVLLEKQATQLQAKIAGFDIDSLKKQLLEAKKNNASTLQMKDILQEINERMLNLAGWQNVGAY